MKNITQELLEKFERAYNNDPKNAIIENAIIKSGIRDSSLNNEVVKKHTFTFSNETKIGSITNQKSSGRCWIFAALNEIRVEMMETLNVENLELAQNYIHFFDKLEKANTYLEFIIQEGLELDNEDRLYRLMNQDPVQDGGYWEFFINIIEKYGICPKSAMNETFHSESTHVLLEQLNWRLKAYTSRMRAAYKAHKNITEIYKIKEQALSDVYNILVKTLGHPPKTFTFEYTDKDKKFQRISNITPMEFFEKYAKETIENKVDLVCDPREEHPKNTFLSMNYLKNRSDSPHIKMLNVDIDVMKQAIIDQIKDGKTVWFGCDVGTYSNSNLGIMDSQLYLYDQTLTKTPEFSKRERFESRASLLSHAMNFVGVNLDENGKPLTWKVENSWGDSTGKKGLFSMSDQWFDDFNYMAIVDKKYLPKEVLEAFDKEAVELSPFDPLV
ncbi:Aminopeptidase C [Metamycoplasma cloacale]|uniref:Aminopeptidase n=1 Tax=Metamycoplasma cloacale TaxID=92401 RepID=A0A2Z4LMC3_9BACT|nr:C1 family peptidase [Metamycoplasma cloacale]AWX42638.1 aminopeptidase [Metamycoplasma cloacale]VEU79584.1 Aminopeptidase C [Metamycoplasma cloacale]